MCTDVLRRLAAVGAVAVAAACLGPLAWERGQRAVAILPGAVRALATTTPEERRLASYGDRDRLGYGYISRMMTGFPDPEAAPVVRIPEDDPRPMALLAGIRSRHEDRVLIAIGVSDADIRERVIARADRRADGTWAFRTVTDFETLTAFRFSIASTSPARMPVVLRHSPQHPRHTIGEWEVPVPVHRDDVVEFRLANPVRRFSLGRGATPFLLEISGIDRGQTSAAPVSAIDVLGVKIDMSPYEVVNREPNCLTAIRRDFLSEIRGRPGHPWARYVESISNVPRE